MKKALKKILPILILCCFACVAILLVACDSQKGTTDVTDTTNTVNESPTNTTPTDTTPTDTTPTDTTPTDTTPTDTTPTDTTPTDNGEAVNAYTITFVCDDQATVTVYETKNATEGTVTTTAYARSGDTGEILIDGEGQVNFSIAVENGYEPGGITVTGTYKNLKNPAETGVDGLYRITKIESDLTVTIKANPAETKYTATFVLDEGVTVTIYDTKDTTTGGTVATTAYARNGETGELLSDGEGQINFVVSLANGLELDKITITGSYKNLKQDPNENGSTNVYRITKVKSDLTITVTTK